MSSKRPSMDVRARRLMGFVQKYGVHETQGKLFYLFQRGKAGEMDQYVGVGPNPNRVWNEAKGAYDNPETLGLLPNHDDYGSAFGFSYDQAIDIIRKSKDADLEMISVDEVQEQRKRKGRLG